MSLADLQQDLSLALDARRAILTGTIQAGSEAGKSFTHLSLNDLNTLINDLRSQIASANGRRIFAPIRKVNL